jgi:hypothetical protein
LHWSRPDTARQVHCAAGEGHLLRGRTPWQTAPPGRASGRAVVAPGRMPEGCRRAGEQGKAALRRVRRSHEEVDAVARKKVEGVE